MKNRIEMIRFKFDKRGRRIAQRWWVTSTFTDMEGRWVKMNSDEAAVLISMGAARDVTHEKWAGEQPIGGGAGKRGTVPSRRYQSKPGKYGTLWLYRIAYRDDSPGAPVFSWKTWAYDEDHAVERFYDSDDGDAGWKIVAGPTRVPEGAGSQGGKRRHAPVKSRATRRPSRLGALVADINRLVK